MKIIGTHGGLVGNGGSTHYAVEDLALMCALTNMTVTSIGDPVMVGEILRQSMTMEGPIYIRLAVGKTDKVLYEPGEHDIRIGKGIIAREGTDATIFTHGTVVAQALDAAEELAKDGRSVRVVDMFTLKPIDEELIVQCAAETGGRFVVLEDHLAYGGLASRVADVVADRGIRLTAFERLGIPQVYAGFGDDEELRDKHGYGLAATIAATRRVIAAATSEPDRPRSSPSHSTESPMRTVAVTKIGSLRDPDEQTRGRIGVVEFPDQPLGPEDVRIRVAYAGDLRLRPAPRRGVLRHRRADRAGPRDLRRHRGARRRRAPQRTAGRRPGRGQLPALLRHLPPVPGGQAAVLRAHPGLQPPRHGRDRHVARVAGLPLPDEVTLLKGCLLEPTSVAVRIADKTGIKVGDRVAVCGGGPIGQLALQVMKRYGATSLTMIEPIAERREMALRHGAEFVVDPIAENQYERADQITDGRGYDVVIDASGSSRAVKGLLDIAAKGATVVYGAMYPADFEMPLNLSDYLYLKELTLTGVFVSPYAFPRALQILPHLELDEMTQAVFPLEQATEAFEVHVSGEYPKVIIRCNDIDEGGQA